MELARRREHFRRAIDLNPSYAIAHHWFGEFLILMTRFDEGMAELKEAERLDPLSLSIEAELARALYRARRYDESIAQPSELSNSTRTSATPTPLSPMTTSKRKCTPKP
jgi:tetratricopeptide (TPR) repeat protein